MENSQKCAKCSEDKESLNLLTCSHKICSGCLFNYFISNNFNSLNTETVKILCPQCQKGSKTFNLNEWIDILEQLSSIETLPNKSTKSFNKSTSIKYCPSHKKKPITKYCHDCKIPLCDSCLKEVHNIYYSSHEIEDIKQVIRKGRDNESKISEEDENNLGFSFGNKKFRHFEFYIKEKQKNFFDKVEEEFSDKKSKIEELISLLKGVLNKYSKEMEKFEKDMKKVFKILSLSYYKYFHMNEKELRNITVTTNLEDIKLKNSKDLEALTEIRKDYQSKLKTLKEKIDEDMNENNFNNNNNYNNHQEKMFNFELLWENQTMKKNYTLIPGDDHEKDSVTKLVALKKSEGLAASLINGLIYIWDKDLKEIYFEIKAHKSSIWSMIELSNGFLVSGSSDKSIKIWDVKNKNDKSVTTFRGTQGHQATVFCLGEIEPTKIISGSEDKTLKIWDLDLKQCTLSLIEPNNSKINSLVTMNDTNYVITGGDDNIIKLWNLEEQSIPSVLQGHDCTIWCLEIFSNDKFLASGSSDNVIKIWDLTKMVCLFTLEGHLNTISSLKIMNNGLLASTSWDMSLKMWNLSSRSCIFTLKGHKGIIWDVVQLDSDEIATCSSDKSIIVWNKK